jgi:hypothetical protein
MGRLMSDKAWDKYKSLVTQFLDEESGMQPVIWAEHVKLPGKYGEDNNNYYYRRDIRALCYYNAFRNWPLNKSSVTGELDEENLSILISKKQVEELEALTPEGYFKFDWAMDRFIINGVVYRPSGDTQVAQAKDEALVFLIILKRDHISTIKYITEKEVEDMFKDSNDGELVSLLEGSI